MYKVANKHEKINIKGTIKVNEPMKDHCWFQTGGPASLFIEPLDKEDLLTLLHQLNNLNLNWFILGGGANILPSDKGFSDVVISMKNLNQISYNSTTLRVEGGYNISDAAAFGADNGLGGLDFIYAMPGSVGGALWMNARCYGGEISKIFKKATIINEKLEYEEIPFNKEEWDYKISPFQTRNIIIIEAELSLKSEESQKIWSRMDEIKKDREEKGHFRAPCGGSTFKNNRQFGAPSGKLIEEAGLKGLSFKGAQVAPWHGNILINAKQAQSRDIYELIKIVQQRVFDQKGFLLEPEVLMVGDWEV